MRTKLGEFTIDPATPEFEKLRSVCEPGNPWRCLIGTKASMEVGKRVSVRLDHDKGTGVIGVTEGDWRFERPMTPDEVKFATDFDLGADIRKPLKVTLDLSDGNWDAAPRRASRGGRKTAANNNGRGPANRQIKTIRGRQLEAIRQAHDNALRDAS